MNGAETNTRRLTYLPTYEERLRAQLRQRTAERLAMQMLAAIHPERRWLDMPADERQRWCDAAMVAFESGKRAAGTCGGEL